ncbi:hypothetical protein PTTG_25258 [Puccinia triticina 1-1 BBBD Race 1]|uniref:Uncharacterized protein n=1 Tax=Puccinia triticina (isolate 1-1 / race 1 (BBBD)) TaxID=630390 RepID=A0A180H3X4_PUCT1|nr:hypothetical protein PTTG_25258 [Puccinia triticina 1-1 BBBD Race 1]
MADSRAGAAAAKKAKNIIRDRSDNATVQKSLADQDEVVPEPQTSTTPGNGPVETTVQTELMYKEADGVNPLGDPGEEERQTDEPNFIEYMKSVPNAMNPSLDTKSILLEQALQAQAAGNAALANC